jgi:transcription elongation factor Elf1
MTQYSSCPGCGFNEKSSFFSGSHFYIYKCKNCGHKFVINVAMFTALLPLQQLVQNADQMVMKMEKFI